MALSSLTRLPLDAAAGQGVRSRGTYPLWACWNGELGQRYTLGVEDEVMLLEPSRWSLAQSSDQVLARLSDELSPHASPETHAAVVELATGIHPDVDGVVGELASLRNRLARRARRDGPGRRRGRYPSAHRLGGDRDLRRAEISPARGVDARARPPRADDGSSRARGGPGARRRDPAAQRPAPQRAGAARPVGQLSVLAGTRYRVRLRADRDLPGVPSDRPATVFRQLRATTSMRSTR